MTSISLKTLDIENAKIGEGKNFELSADLTLISPKNLAYTVQWQLAKKRSGNSKVKSMSEISGTTAKPYKQKGTGNARQGSKRSVQFVGGRTCHGPSPRSYDFAMPKKMIKKSLSDALKIKLQSQNILLLTESYIGASKTKIVANAFAKNNISKALLVLDLSSDDNQKFALAARNLKNVKIIDVRSINVYDILSFDNIIVENKEFEDKILKLIK